MLLSERATLAGFTVPATISAGGGCRIFEARNSAVALNLSRPDDRDSLPALFACDPFPTDDPDRIAERFAACDANHIVARGRDMGLAIASEDEGSPAGDAVQRLVETSPAPQPEGRRPLVVDLSALWAGPLAGRLLRLAGADVLKVESRTRPDAARDGEPDFFALLNHGKASVALDFQNAEDRTGLHSLLRHADIVLEAARPRALRQLGIDAEAILRERPGMVWITITGHGAREPAANWVGFGDDCGFAAGLSAALRDAAGAGGFVGDAIADPLTGIRAALAAWTAWRAGAGGRYGVSMRAVVAEAMDEAQADDTELFHRDLRVWRAAAGAPFPGVPPRAVCPASPFGADTRDVLASFASSGAPC